MVIEHESGIMTNRESVGRRQPATARQLPTVDMRSIEEVFKRSPEISGCNIRVSAADGKVRLRGQVHTWNERDEARRLAWTIQGVQAVEDWLEVCPDC